jgi:hypothetical protein
MVEKCLFSFREDDFFFSKYHKVMDFVNPVLLIILIP